MPDDLERNKYSQKDREAMDESDFAGPHMSFPIKDQEDVDNAARLIGHADDPEAVKAKIKSIAKRKGLTLPDAWQEKEDNMDKVDAPDIVRNMPSELQLYMPIQRIDREKREIVARATSEALDSYKTVFSYEGSKEAFSKWKGNIREMHDASKAVGRAIEWKPVDEEKSIDVTLRVSRGAEDTWQKVLDGTLSGLSVGARNGKWTKKQLNGEEVPYLERYELVEVSLVDNPANPDCNISIVRSDGIATEVVDETPDEEELPEAAEVVRAEEPEVESVEEPEEERAGARVSADTKGKMHSARDHALQSAKALADNCGCEECIALAGAMDPDLDGDIDLVSNLDTDSDGGASGDGSGDGALNKAAIAELVRSLKEELTKHVEAQITRNVAPEIQRQMNPSISRLSGIAAQFAQINTSQNTPDIERKLDALEQKLAGLDEVRSLLSEVKGLAKSIAEQPQAGGPIVNSAAMRSMQTQQVNSDVLTRFAADINKSGIARTPQDQSSVVTLLQKYLGQQ